jgi:hypothetical protein
MTQLSLHAALIWQSNVCKGMGAPMSAEVLRLMAQDEAIFTALAPALTAFADQTPKDILNGAVPLRVLGAAHFLVLNKDAPALADCYAKSGGPHLAQSLLEAISAHPDVFKSFTASPPQTNEVQRSLCLFGGFLTVAAETGLPLRCLELGASAGLNLNWDRFDYNLGPLGRWGDAASPVKLSGDWSGGAPPLHANVEVAERSACDQSPVDVRDEAAALRLLAYVWPDQPDRMARARAAIDLARAADVRVEKADAADWTALHAKPCEGVATVLYHSVFWQYPPKETRAAIRQAIEAAGEVATTAAPFAWLRMEPDPDNPTGAMEVRLTSWPGGEDRLFALVHPHGATVNWLGATEIDA